MSAADAYLLALALAAAAPPTDALDHPFDAAVAGEAVATIRAGCARCDWGEPGREAAALRISIDGRYSQHLVLARGEQPGDYHVSLGEVAAGPHHLQIARDGALSAK